MGDDELLAMLATETDRRASDIIEAITRLVDSGDPDSAGVEAIRVEIHGLKGAASVVGATRLAELAREIESALVQRTAPGTIPPDLASRVIDAAAALRDGARAASRGEPEPASIAAAIDALANR